MTSGRERDRDRAGRPRNARPRDHTGRPLPRTAVGTPPDDDDPGSLPPAGALAEAQRLIDGDRPFAAHEVLEAVWKSAGAPERPLWRALAQLAVGLTHLQRGNRSGAATLLRRGAGGLTEYSGPALGVDGDRVAAEARELAAAIDRGESVTPALRLDSAG